MKHIARDTLILSAALTVSLLASLSHAASDERDVLEAMKKAAGFMANTVSNRGGYVYRYSNDLTRQWGEIPARSTQIWTQPPGTPTVGEMYLDAYRVTGEREFLDYAERAANALILGQHPAGGWNYFIDFDMPGIRQWYEEVASKCWGFEEYYHYYDNCTFDDQATTAPTQLLLNLYMTTLDPKYRTPLLKALDFILEAQRPNGAWPQRYPIMDNFPYDGKPDYTPYHTFNDGVIRENIDLLIDAWERLGNEEYLKAARRGMDFYLISQYAKPQAGWAQQYSLDMRPAAARTYEPAALNVVRTVININDLMTFYTITGDRRYLSPIPAAIEWLEHSVINTDPSKDYTHAGFYELDTNLPLYYHFAGNSKEDWKYWIDHDITDSYRYRRTAKPDIARIKRNFERVSALAPEQAMAEYAASRNAVKRVARPGADEVNSIISSLDNRGAWVSEFRTLDYSKGMIDGMYSGVVEGIEIPVFLRNMQTLIRRLDADSR